MLKQAEWRTLPLGEIAEVHDDLRLPINATERAARIEGKAQADLFPYYGATGQVGWIDDYRMDGRYVLVGEDGAPFLDPLARKAYIVDGRTWVNNHAHILRGKTDVLDDRFLKFALDVTDYRSFVNGTTRLKLTQGSLRQIPIRLPSIELQRQIVERIEELFSELGDAEEELRRARAELDTHRNSLLKAAVTGELTADWRAANPPKETGADLLARILTDRRARWEADPKNKGKRYKEPGGASVVPFELPEGWCWAACEQLTQRATYGTSVKCSEEDSGPPVLRMGNIQNGMLSLQKLKFAPANADVPILSPGDVLFNRTNSPELVGKTAVFEIEEGAYSYASYLVAIRFHGILPHLFVSWMNSAFGQSWIAENRSQQVGQANVSAGKLLRMAIPVPPPDEQAELAQRVQRASRAARDVAFDAKVAEDGSATLRQSILAAAFRGELVQ